MFMGRFQVRPDVARVLVHAKSTIGLPRLRNISDRERAFSDVGDEGRRWRPCYCTKLGFGNAKIFSFKAKTAANKHATLGSSDKVTVIASPRAKKALIHRKRIFNMISFLYRGCVTDRQVPYQLNTKITKSKK